MAIPWLSPNYMSYRVPLVQIPKLSMFLVPMKQCATTFCCLLSSNQTAGRVKKRIPPKAVAVMKANHWTQVIPGRGLELINSPKKGWFGTKFWWNQVETNTAISRTLPFPFHFSPLFFRSIVSKKKNEQNPRYCQGTPLCDTPQKTAEICALQRAIQCVHAKNPWTGHVDPNRYPGHRRKLRMDRDGTQQHKQVPAEKSENSKPKGWVNARNLQIFSATMCCPASLATWCIAWVKAQPSMGPWSAIENISMRSVLSSDSIHFSKIWSPTAQTTHP